MLITAIFIVLLASCKPKVDETFWETELEPKMIDALKISYGYGILCGISRA